MCDLPFLALILTKDTLFKSLMENQDIIFCWLPAVGHRHRADPFEQRGGATSSLYLCQCPGTEKKQLSNWVEQLSTHFQTNEIYDLLYNKPLTLIWFWF